MAAPNIVNVSKITGKTAVVTLNSTSAIDIVENPALSGQVFKINSLYAANIDGVNACNISITVDSKKIAHTISVPADSTLVVVSKDASIYLEENKKIIATAGAANGIDIICSYEEIS